jgi:hypothetical protein
MIKLTPTLKRRITRDWNEQFPQMGVFRPMWLMRRVGPLVQGICLDRSSAGTSYRPTTHIHDLTVEFQCISLSLDQRLRDPRSGTAESIGVQFHDRLYLEAARRLAGASLLPMIGDIPVESIVEAYERYRTSGELTSTYPVRYFESAVRLLAWTGRIEDGYRTLAGYVSELRSSATVLADAPDDIEAWERALREVLADPVSIRRTATEQAVALKVDRLPQSSLL